MVSTFGASSALMEAARSEASALTTNLTWSKRHLLSAILPGNEFLSSLRIGTRCCFFSKGRLAVSVSRRQRTREFFWVLRKIYLDGRASEREDANYDEYGRAKRQFRIDDETIGV